MNIGKQTINFKNVYIVDTASAVGPKEATSKFSKNFDVKCSDIYFGEKTFEKAESKYLKSAIDSLIIKTGYTNDKIDMIIGGDLLNQCIATSYAVRDFNLPFLGMYNACSTFVESAIVGSCFIDNNQFSNIITCASSHFCTAEKQYRLPLEHGNQKTPTSQNTVTGAGALLLSNNGKLKITEATIGKIVDMGIKDINNMGAAMAPAAFDTITTYFEDTKKI